MIIIAAGTTSYDRSFPIQEFPQKYCLERRDEPDFSSIRSI